METTHENSRFRSQLLEKTSVLKSALLARLKSQFLPSATATLHKNMERDYFVTEPKIQLSDVKKSHFAPENSGG
jgi:hypothetical protein